MTELRKTESDPEITVLLALLSGRQDNVILQAGFNHDRFMKLTMMHKVSYQVLQYARQHTMFLSAEWVEKLGNKCRQIALVSLGQLQELVRITRRLHENDIAFAVIKGPQLARMIYGREALKESVDLDMMLMSQSDFTRTHGVLTRLGYTWSNLNDYKTTFSQKVFLLAKREVQYTSPTTRCHIDLHVRPGANTYLTAKLFRNFFDDFESYDLEGVGMPVPPPEKYLVYLCYHGSLHQFSRLAWLLDIRTFLLLKKNMLDYPKLLSIARSLRTERSLFLAMRLLQEYFGDEIPEPLKNQFSHSKRMNSLVKRCRRMIDKDEGYGLSWPGRIGKLMYMMMLIKGFAGKIDLLYGIFMRMLIGGLKE
jgi:hypothetical protein